MHKKKSEIQNKGIEHWWNNGGSGTLAMATGTGKSKIGVDVSVANSKSTLIVVPTEKLRDHRWEEEFKKWGHLAHYNSYIDRSCYVSISKIKGKTYDLVILDEAHHITESNYEFFSNNNVKYVLALTATPPRDIVKQDLLFSIAPLVFEYSLDEAVTDKVVSPYKINVVYNTLSQDRTLLRSFKSRPSFYTSELKNYDYLSKTLTAAIYTGNQNAVKRWALERMRFLQNLPSKIPIAKKILEQHIPEDDRTLIYAGSIEGTIELCPYRYFSKPSFNKSNKQSVERANKLMKYYNGDKDYWRFIRGEINRLASIQMLNEGEDIAGLDSALITAFNSNPKNLIQQIGRLVRFREGHEATIWLLCTLGTQEEKWLEKATNDLDSSNFTYMNAKNL